MSTHAPHLVLPVGRRDHVRGPSSARVTLVEYGDFECPHCAAAYPAVEELLSRMGQDVRFVYRHFPVTTTHPHAESAAEAAEAAGAQRKFWEMHRQLFEHADRLEYDDLVGDAEAIGLDLARFERELDDRAHASRVRDDFMSGVRSGVNGTPTFFINDLRHDGGHDLVSLMLAVEHASGAG
jgi:protein-disulfide isomerase